MKLAIMAFARSKQGELHLTTERTPISVVLSTLDELGFEYGEEQESDGVLYSQFHHDYFESIMLKKPFDRNEYILEKE